MEAILGDADQQQIDINAQTGVGYPLEEGTIEFDHGVTENDNSSSASFPSAGFKDAQIQQDAPGSTLKRKRDEFDGSAPLTNPARQRSSDQYRELLNSYIHETNSLQPGGDDPALEASQLGCVIWSAAEKDIFFEALRRLGQDNIRVIAKAISTKSEVEVSDYLQRIRDAKRTLAQLEPAQLLEEHCIPAAHEIGENCCSALDDEAESLRFLELDQDIAREQSRFGDYWLLDEAAASAIRDEQSRGQTLLEPADQDSQVPASALPDELAHSTELLNLNKWLHLSKQVFMNRGPPNDDDHWINLAGEDEAPAIFATAFIDFSNLAVSYTKRILHASLFQAMARLRASDWKGANQPLLSVRREDVHTALDILNAPRSSHEFWARAPRRLQLRVHNPTMRADRVASARNIGQPLSYDEVEEHLRAGADDLEDDVAELTIEELDSEMSSSSNVPESDNEPAEHSKGQFLSSGEAGENDESEDGSETAAIAEAIQRLQDEEDRQAATDAEKDAYLEALDTQASLEEERRLWILLRRYPKSHMDKEVPPRPAQNPKPPGLKREPPEKKDWRDWMDFRSEWERYGYIVPDHAFQPFLLRKDVDASNVQHQKPPKQPAAVDDDGDSASVEASGSDVSMASASTTRSRPQRKRAKVSYSQVAASIDEDDAAAPLPDLADSDSEDVYEPK